MGVWQWPYRVIPSLPITNLNSPLLHVCTNALVLDASSLELCVLGKSKLTSEAAGDDSSFSLLEKSLFEKLTGDHNCIAKFFPTYCDFRNYVRGGLAMLGKWMDCLSLKKKKSHGRNFSGSPMRKFYNLCERNNFMKFVNLQNITATIFLLKFMRNLVHSPLCNVMCGGALSGENNFRC